MRGLTLAQGWLWCPVGVYECVKCGCDPVVEKAPEAAMEQLPFGTEDHQISCGNENCDAARFEGFSMAEVAQKWNRRQIDLATTATPSAISYDPK